MKTVSLVLLMLIALPALADKSHVVEYGESLWRISKKHYGTGEKWRWIWRANRKIIRRPSHIRPGQKLRIPKDKPKKKSRRDVPTGFEYWKTKKMVVRAYCPRRCCCQAAADGKTKLMDDAWVMDGAAVAFSVIPRRTMMWIPKVGWKEADDTGPSPRRGARRGQYRIEIRMASHWKARRWGRPTLRVDLYRKIGRGKT